MSYVSEPLPAAALARVASLAASALAENASDPVWLSDDGFVCVILDAEVLVSAAGCAFPQDVVESMPAVLAALRRSVPDADWSDNGAAGWDWSVLFQAPPASLAG